MDDHNEAVKRIASAVKSFHEKQKPFRLYHGSTNSTRTSERRADNTINTSALNHVLAVSEGTALVEPNVPMDALVAATLPRGLVPPVVMEFPGITVGGGFSGTSGESSSFRHGAFDTTVLSIEIVLPDGTVARVSKTDRPDVFWGAASAFGTLGVVTLLEVRLVPAKRYVALTYSLARGADETTERLREACDCPENDYVDGIVFTADKTLLCTGRMVDGVPPGQKVQRFTRRSDPWFYIRAGTMLKMVSSSKDKTAVDYMPLQDYLFRYDRGGFWVARYSFRYFLTPFNRITRFALDRFMHTRVMYRAVHKSGLADYYMVQDVGVPFSAAANFQNWLDTQFGIYPLWVCPLRVQREDADSRHGLHASFADPNTEDMVNFGVWGPMERSKTRRQVVERNRELEREVHRVGGKKWLYAHAYYTEDEFWAHYDRESYDGLRVKYHATHLPSVYDKVKVDVDKEEAEERAAGLKGRFWGMWPIRGLYGFYGAARGGDYLMGKKRWEKK